MTPEKVSTVAPSFSSTSMMTALGLALRELSQNPIEVNLLPAALKPKKKKPKVKTTLAIAAALVLIFVASIASKITYNNKTLDSLEQQLSEIKVQVGTLEKIDLEYEGLKLYVDKLNNINRLYPPRLPIMMELSRVLPADTWVSKITITGEEMEIKGISAAASRLVPLMEQSSYFKETGFKGAIINEGGGEKFTMHTDVKVAP